MEFENMEMNRFVTVTSTGKESFIQKGESKSFLQKVTLQLYFENREGKESQYFLKDMIDAKKAVNS